MSVEDVLLAALRIAVPGGIVTSGPAVVVADERVLRLHPPAGDRPVLTVPAGEAAKSLAVVERLWRELTLGRDGTIIALGGGSTTDLVGFVAATYLRGDPLDRRPDDAHGPGRRRDRGQDGHQHGRREEPRRRIPLPGVGRHQPERPGHAPREGAPCRHGRGREDRSARGPRCLEAEGGGHDPRLRRVQGRRRPLRPVRDRGPPRVAQPRAHVRARARGGLRLPGLPRRGGRARRSSPRSASRGSPPTRSRRSCAPSRSRPTSTSRGRRSSETRRARASTSSWRAPGRPVRHRRVPDGEARRRAGRAHPAVDSPPCRWPS